MTLPHAPLNYHHLRLFWAVARDGHLTSASRKLGLTPQTVSSQIRDLEGALGEQLFRRVGRGLELTSVGRVTLEYAEDIFATGQELLETLRGQPTDRPAKLNVGIVSALPKLVAHHLVDPALRLDTPVRLLCRQGRPEDLIADLALHRVDVVLSDAPVPNNLRVKAYNHLLGECGITFMASPKLAARLRRRFPQSLDGVPVLLPSNDAAVRGAVDNWFRAHGVQPVLVGEFDDSGLLKTFGQAMDVFWPVPSVVEADVVTQYGARAVGRTPDVVERFFAITVERRVRHPAVAAICETARSELFANTP
jgi:LysR family transcriptional activator of nhaA